MDAPGNGLLIAAIITSGLVETLEKHDGLKTNKLEDRLKSLNDEPEMKPFDFFDY